MADLQDGKKWEDRSPEEREELMARHYVADVSLLPVSVQERIEEGNAVYAQQVAAREALDAG